MGGGARQRVCGRCNMGDVDPSPADHVWAAGVSSASRKRRSYRVVSCRVGAVGVAASGADDVAPRPGLGVMATEAEAEAEPGASDVAARRVCGGGQSGEEQRGQGQVEASWTAAEAGGSGARTAAGGWGRAGYAGRVNCARRAGAVPTTALGRIGRACRRCYGQDAGTASRPLASTPSLVVTCLAPALPA